MKHRIPLGTPVAFDKDESKIRYVVDYQDLLYCHNDCNLDHDHFEVPYINVQIRINTAMPIHRLKYIFDKKNDIGRLATPHDKGEPHFDCTIGKPNE